MEKLKMSDALQLIVDQFGGPEGSDFTNKADYIAAHNAKQQLAKHK